MIYRLCETFSCTKNELISRFTMDEIMDWSSYFHKKDQYQVNLDKKAICEALSISFGSKK